MIQLAEELYTFKGGEIIKTMSCNVAALIQSPNVLARTLAPINFFQIGLHLNRRDFLHTTPICSIIPIILGSFYCWIVVDNVNTGHIICSKK